MELMEVITTRRSVRRYRQDPVPRELMEELLTAACWAPSAENQQPWYFVALTEAGEIARLHATMDQVAASLKPHLEAQFAENPEPTAPFGTKALGEPPACSGAPAIRNAIAHATGVGLNRCPMTPHVLFEAFKEAGLV